MFAMTTSAVSRYLTFMLLILLLMPTTAQAETKDMTFELMAECSGNMCKEYILAKGKITSTSTAYLLVFLAKHPYDLEIVFDSPGGDLRGGMSLGETIRRRGLHTAVYDSYVFWDGWLPDHTENFQERRAICNSACSLAILGGVHRTVGSRAQIGLHRFRSTVGDAGEAKAQDIVADIMKYVASLRPQTLVFATAAS